MRGGPFSSVTSADSDMKIETAEECEDYCRTYSSCSIKITAKAVYIPMEPKIKEPE